MQNVCSVLLKRKTLQQNILGCCFLNCTCGWEVVASLYQYSWIRICRWLDVVEWGQGAVVGLAVKVVTLALAGTLDLTEGATFQTGPCSESGEVGCNQWKQEIELCSMNSYYPRALIEHFSHVLQMGVII